MMGLRARSRWFVISINPFSFIGIIVIWPRFIVLNFKRTNFRLYLGESVMGKYFFVMAVDKVPYTWI